MFNWYVYWLGIELIGNNYDLIIGNMWFIKYVNNII